MSFYYTLMQSLFTMLAKKRLVSMKDGHLFNAFR